MKDSYWRWFHDKHYLLSRSKDFLFIGRTEELDQDFIELKKILRLPQEVQLPRDSYHAHKSPGDEDRYLSENAILNLRKWYRKDYDFVEIISQLKKNGH